MSQRIQPRELEIPEHNPFENDLLGRKESIEILTHLVGSFDGPCVMAIDAPWGHGKTTFLKIWDEYLRNKEFRTIEFNAWETDYSKDPFVTLSSELVAGFERYKDDSTAKKIADHAKDISAIILPHILSAAIPGPAGNIIGSYVENQITAYRKKQISVKEFTQTLQNAVKQEYKNTNKPLIIIIDELDRCRPSYAIELLEVAKHVFAVDHIVFVLAVNRSQLSHSVKALYGNDFDAYGYLKRFFDVDFRLPDPSREKFIDKLLLDIQIESYFRRTLDQYGRGEFQSARQILNQFFDSPALDLRTITQAIHHLGVVFASLPNEQKSFVVSAVIALIIRTIESETYYRFVRGDADDVEVVDALFNKPWTKGVQQEFNGCLVEAMIIVGRKELSRNPRIKYRNTESPLLTHYKNLLKEGESHKEFSHAKNVIDWVQKLSGFGINQVGFDYSVKRIELLSPAFIEQPEEVI